MNYLLSRSGWFLLMGLEIGCVAMAIQFPLLRLMFFYLAGFSSGLALANTIVGELSHKNDH